MILWIVIIGMIFKVDWINACPHKASLHICHKLERSNNSLFDKFIAAQGMFIFKGNLWLFESNQVYRLPLTKNMEVIEQLQFERNNKTIQPMSMLSFDWFKYPKSQKQLQIQKMWLIRFEAETIWIDNEEIMDDIYIMTQRNFDIVLTTFYVLTDLLKTSDNIPKSIFRDWYPCMMENDFSLILDENDRYGFIFRQTNDNSFLWNNFKNNETCNTNNMFPMELPLKSLPFGFIYHHKVFIIDFKMKIVYIFNYHQITRKTKFKRNDNVHKSNGIVIDYQTMHLNDFFVCPKNEHNPCARSSLTIVG